MMKKIASPECLKETSAADRESPVPGATFRILPDPLLDHPLIGLGVEAEPPPFLWRDPKHVTPPLRARIWEVIERRLALLRPAIARLFCMPEQWNPSLDGRTYTWDHPDLQEYLRMIRFLDRLGCGINLVLFTQFQEPIETQRRAVYAMIGFIQKLRDDLGIRNIRWLTLFNEPESVFRQDSPLARAIFGHDPPLHTWDEYVSLNRMAMELLRDHRMGDIRLVVPDVAWGGRMRRERMTLTAAAFPTEDVCFSCHHYNPEDREYYETVPDAYQYDGLQEEVERYRRLIGPTRQLIVWEFNYIGRGFDTHNPGVDTKGRIALEAPDAGAHVAYRVINSLRYGVDGLCLWHMNDGDVNKFGLWRSPNEHFGFKPHWYAFRLLTAAFRPGQWVLRVEGDSPAISLVATRDGQEKLRAALVNTSETPAIAEIRSADCDWRLAYRVGPVPSPSSSDEGLDIHDQPVAMERTGILRIPLEPWELVVLSNDRLDRLQE